MRVLLSGGTLTFYMNIKTWISAFRLRTLPLAISGILMGTYTADVYDESQWSVLILALLTALFLQILSNLANDYGDYAKGTDNQNRLGNTRALQSGKITPSQMLRAILIFTILSLFTGLALLFVALNQQVTFAFILFFIIGLAAIAAAIKYTIGKNPYGYSGKGDIMVFIFFGPVAVLGTYLLHTHLEIDFYKNWMVILPAVFIGLLSTGVLNTNNIRDIVNDAASGKFTIPVKVGLQKAKYYHLGLMLGSFITTVLFIYFSPVSSLAWLSLLAFIPLGNQAIQVFIKKPSPEFNQLLKLLSMGTLLLVVLFIVSEVSSKLIIVYSALNQ